MLKVTTPVLLVTLLLSACNTDQTTEQPTAKATAKPSEQPAEKKTPLTLEVPDILAEQHKALFIETWSHVLNTCPGLNKYQAALIDPEITYRGYSVKRLIISFSIPNGQTAIPAHYLAGGNNCEYQVSEDGQTLSIPKTACKAVCFDTDTDTTQTDYPLIK